MQHGVVGFLNTLSMPYSFWIAVIITEVLHIIYSIWDTQDCSEQMHGRTELTQLLNLYLWPCHVTVHDNAHFQHCDSVITLCCVSYMFLQSWASMKIMFVQLIIAQQDFKRELWCMAHNGKIIALPVSSHNIWSYFQQNNVTDYIKWVYSKGFSFPGPSDKTDR